MRTGIRIGRIAGIDVSVDWSLAVVFLLLIWNLMAVFSLWHPSWGVGLSLLLAAVAAVMFFVSVLLHELAHSLVARAQGLPVRSILLWLFGGISDLEREPASPRTEFLSAIA